MSGLKRKSGTGQLAIDGLIILSFILCAVFNAAFLLHHQMIVGADTGFHWQEIFELMKSRSFFPQFAMNSFSNNGSAILTMFPYLLLWPFIWGLRLFHSVSLSSYFVFGLNTFLTLMISYYSSLKISRRKLVSYSFALMYALSYVFIIRSFWSYDVGMTYSAVFMPLVIFGFIAFLRSGRWITLAVGMSLIIYSNVIVAVFVPVILLVWLLCNYRSFNWQKLINLGKAVGLTLLITAAFWIPALHIFTLNSMHTPNINHLSGVSSWTLFQKALDPAAVLQVGKFPFSLTIATVLGLIVGGIFIVHSPALIKQFYLVSLLVIILCSDCFPWGFFDHHLTFVRTLQFPWRLYLIPQLLLVYVLAHWLVHALDSCALSKNSRLIMVGLIFISILSCQFSMQHLFLQQFRRYPATMRVYPATVATLNQNLITNHSNCDYYPNAALKFSHDILRDRGVYSSQHEIHSIQLVAHGQGRFTFVLKHDVKDLSIPFLDYHGVRYRVYSNHRKVYFSSRHQLVTIYHLRRGIYHLTVFPSLGLVSIMSRILSGTGLIMLLSLGIRKYC